MDARICQVVWHTGDASPIPYGPVSETGYFNHAHDTIVKHVAMIQFDADEISDGEALDKLYDLAGVDKTRVEQVKIWNDFI